jgi:hypothetical protein
VAIRAEGDQILRLEWAVTSSQLVMIRAWGGWVTR